MPEFPSDPRLITMIFGLAIAGIGAIGFVVCRTIVGTHMTKSNHPDLYINGVETMKRMEKRRHYNRVTRKATMSGKGRYWFWLSIGGFALLWGAALYPIFTGLGQAG